MELPGALLSKLVEDLSMMDNTVFYRYFPARETEAIAMKWQGQAETLRQR